MQRDGLGAEALRTWAWFAVAALERHRGELDALNVFPVADSDTGTNLYLTLREAAESVDRLERDACFRDVGRAFARGALMGARGNSGVIVSQYLGALLRCLARQPHAPGLGEALHQATQAAYRAVGHPIEGTVLTVARAVGDGAGAAAPSGALTVLEGGIEAGYVALARTTAQLAPLREAGVLDAGGWGLMLVLDAFADALRGHRRERQPPAPEHRVPAPVCCDHDDDAVSADYGAGEFEVMFLVRGSEEEPEADGVAAALRLELSRVGESVAVVGGDGLWQAHVHTDDPLAAVGAAGSAGVEPSQIRVRHIASQSGVHGLQQPPLGLVTITAAPGLIAGLARAGAVVVLVGPGATAGPELGRAVDDTGARTVLVLAKAELLTQVPDRAGLRVITDLTEVQLAVGAATWASMDPTVGEERLRAEIERTVRGVRTSCVSGSRDAEDVVAAAGALLDEESTLLTVITSADTPPASVERLRAVVEDRVELVVLEGAAPGDQVVLGAE